MLHQHERAAMFHWCRVILSGLLTGALIVGVPCGILIGLTVN